MAVLKELYEAKKAGPIQFTIEVASAKADVKAYERLNSPCGAFISILSPVDPNQYTKPKERSLLFQCSYFVAAVLNCDVELQTNVVLIHQGSLKKIVLPSKGNFKAGSFQPGSSGGWGGAVVLPADLAPGRYHVYHQISAGEKIISVSHGFAADL